MDVIYVQRKRGFIMKVISFKGLKELPVCAKVIWTLAIICALTGIVTMLLEIFEICDIKLCVSLVFIVASQIFNVFGLNKYKDVLYIEVGKK